MGVCSKRRRRKKGNVTDDSYFQTELEQQAQRSHEWKQDMKMQRYRDLRTNKGSRIFQKSGRSSSAWSSGRKNKRRKRGSESKEKEKQKEKERKQRNGKGNRRKWSRKKRIKPRIISKEKKEEEDDDAWWRISHRFPHNLSCRSSSAHAFPTGASLQKCKAEKYWKKDKIMRTKTWRKRKKKKKKRKKYFPLRLTCSSCLPTSSGFLCLCRWEIVLHIVWGRDIKLFWVAWWLRKEKRKEKRKARRNSPRQHCRAPMPSQNRLQLNDSYRK